jgi:hypothetical protein
MQRPQSAVGLQCSGKLGTSVTPWCGDGPDPGIHACQVAAVSIVRCTLGTTHEDCENKFFSNYPGNVSPIGMELGLYDCAVCSACAADCATAPESLTFCCGGPASGCHKEQARSLLAPFEPYRSRVRLR